MQQIERRACVRATAQLAVGYCRPNVMPRKSGAHWLHRRAPLSYDAAMHAALLVWPVSKLEETLRTNAARTFNGVCSYTASCCMRLKGSPELRLPLIAVRRSSLQHLL